MSAVPQALALDPHAQWLAQATALEADVAGLSDEEWDDRFAEVDRIHRRIAETPAASLGGVAAQLGFVVDAYRAGRFGHIEADALATALSSVEALNQAAAAG